jgi:hypothetical protein
VDTIAASPDAAVLTPYTPATSRPPADAPPAPTPWPQWRLIVFRFLCIYLVLQIEPWDFFGAIPGVSYLLRPYGIANEWLVQTANAKVFHIADTLVPVNGSGDTSWAWTRFALLLSLAAIGCGVWTVLDRKRTQYDRLDLWLRMIVRYYVAGAALSYGIIKILALQMPFPTLSQLATPLGDLLPMRFSWLFIGYSLPYQIFSGTMEFIAGLLLLYRRTITAGLFAATGAFLNVVMINLAYDVPVKHYASHLLFCCLFLLACDAKRLTNFLVLNRPTPPTHAWEWGFKQPWQRWGSRAVKVFLVWQVLVASIQFNWTRYKTANAPVPPGPFAIGVYDVRQFVLGRDTIPAASADTLRWQDVIFDTRSGGSVNTRDQVFWQRYRRGYFRYRADTATHTLAVWKVSAIPRDSTFLFTMRYEAADSNTVRLHTVIRGDSVHADLVRVPRHFQLAERQFHWISEYNR